MLNVLAKEKMTWSLFLFNFLHTIRQKSLRIQQSISSIVVAPKEVVSARLQRTIEVSTLQFVNPHLKCQSKRFRYIESGFG